MNLQQQVLDTSEYLLIWYDRNLELEVYYRKEKLIEFS